MNARARGRLENLLIRLGLAAVAFFALPEKMVLDTQPFPNGLARYVDLTFLSHPLLYSSLRWLAALALVLYICGRLRGPSLAYVAALGIATYTLSNSQGAIGHTYQVVSLTLAGAVLGYAWFPLREHLTGRDPSLSADDHAAHFSTQMIAAVYVTSGITKLLQSKGAWILDTPNMAVQVIKTNAQNHYNFVAPERIEFGREWAERILEHPGLAMAVFGAGLFFELFAFLSLRSRLWGAFIGAGLWGMHVSVTYLMRLSFSYNKALLLLFFVPVPWLLAWALERLADRTGLARFLPARTMPAGEPGERAS